jgi:Leucine-rich repeat (LRR) protein
MTECTYQNGIYGYTCKIYFQINNTDPITLKYGHLSGSTDKYVQTLQIQNCDMVTFPKNLHELFPNLKYLIIDNCNLEHIGTEHIGKWKKMTKIGVVNCQLRRLEGDLFSGLEELVEINFEGNKIEEIEPEIIDDIKRMSKVNFQNNTNINMFCCRTVG